MRLQWLEGVRVGVEKRNSKVTKFLLKGKTGIKDRKATNVLISNKDPKVSCKLKQ